MIKLQETWLLLPPVHGEDVCLDDNKHAVILFFSSETYHWVHTTIPKTIILKDCSDTGIGEVCGGGSPPHTLSRKSSKLLRDESLGGI